MSYVSQYLIGAGGTLYSAGDLLDSLFTPATNLAATTRGVRPGLYDEEDNPPAGAIIESANDGHLYWVHRDGSVHLLCTGHPYGDYDSGSAAWGEITGTLADQTDLQTALDGKADSSHNHTLSDVTDAGDLAALDTVGTAQIDDGVVTAAKLADTYIDGGTGSTDNIVLRSDGTGGTTAQASALAVQDIVTTSPNDTVNAVVVTVSAATTHAALCLAPKGTGPLIIGSVPDGTAAGGNTRGTNAVDLQRTRGAASDVASGANSVILGGANNATQGQYSIVGGYNNDIGNYRTAIALGYENNVTGGEGVALGMRNTSGVAAFSAGRDNSATAVYSHATGRQSQTSRHAEHARSAGQFSSKGDCQATALQLRNVTTDATPTELFLDGSSLRLTVVAGTVLSCRIRVVGVKSDGSAVARFIRDVTIKNVGGTTTLVDSETIGTDVEDNASTDLSVTADDTNDALAITVTGIAAETWRWTAVVEGAEIAYGS